MLPSFRGLLRPLFWYCIYIRFRKTSLRHKGPTNAKRVFSGLLLGALRSWYFVCDGFIFFSLLKLFYLLFFSSFVTIVLVHKNSLSFWIFVMLSGWTPEWRATSTPGCSEKWARVFALPSTGAKGKEASRAN